MRQRNMWISEPGREREPIPAEPIEEETTEVIPDPNHPLLRRGLSLDEIVPRTWQKWD